MLPFRKVFGALFVAGALLSRVALAGPATHLSVSVPNPTTSFNNMQVSVTALDSSENVDTSYAGTVSFTSSDPYFITPAPLTLAAGMGAEDGAGLKTAGMQTVTATDTTNASITGTTTTLVLPGSTSRFLLTAPSNWTPGVAFSFTVTAADFFGNPTPAYTGTVHFTSTDGAAVVPADSTLTNGTGTFTATFNTLPAQSLTATDTVDSSITGSTEISAPVRLQSFGVD